MTRIPGYVNEILQALERGGHEAWCVGGCVRDRFLGREPQDWDVTTSARRKPQDCVTAQSPSAAAWSRWR